MEDIDYKHIDEILEQIDKDIESLNTSIKKNKKALDID